jgi:hypothetical protein
MVTGCRTLDECRTRAADYTSYLLIVEARPVPKPAVTGEFMVNTHTKTSRQRRNFVCPGGRMAAGCAVCILVLVVLHGVILKYQHASVRVIWSVQYRGIYLLSDCPDICRPARGNWAPVSESSYVSVTVHQSRDCWHRTEYWVPRRRLYLALVKLHVIINLLCLCFAFDEI